SFAVHLAAREHRRLAAVLRARFEDDLGAADVGDQRTQRVLKDVLHTHRRGQVIHAITLGHEPIDQRRVRDAAFEKSEVGMALERAKVLEAAGGEVIESPDFGTLLKKGLRKMGSDEPRTPSDEDSHALPSMEGW